MQNYMKISCCCSHLQSVMYAFLFRVL